MTVNHHRGESDFYGMKLTVGGLAIAFLLTGCGVVRTRGETTTGLSGLEVFSGTSASGGIAGTLFAGRDNKVCNCWTTNDNGGTWTANVSYTGTGQPGHRFVGRVSDWRQMGLAASQ
jgi:hypothetical protein